MLKHIGLMSCFLVRSRRNTIQFSSPQQNKGESPQGEIRKSETKKKKHHKMREERNKKKKEERKEKRKDKTSIPLKCPLCCV